MDEEPLNFEEHRRRLLEDAGKVRCARCGKWIMATAVQCPECGVHFQGEAQYFTHPSERPQAAARPPAWVVAAALLALAATALGLLRWR